MKLCTELYTLKNRKPEKSKKRLDLSTNRNSRQWSSCATATGVTGRRSKNYCISLSLQDTYHLI